MVGRFLFWWNSKFANVPFLVPPKWLKWPNEIGLHYWSCTRWSTTDSNQVHRGQVELEVQWGAAEWDFNLTDCSRVNAGSPSATSVQCWWVGRQVHRGEAEVYLLGHSEGESLGMVGGEKRYIYLTRALLGYAPQRLCPGVNSSLCEEWRDSVVLTSPQLPLPIPELKEADCILAQMRICNLILY